MAFSALALAFVAGVLTVLSRCVLPILPIMLGAAASERRWGDYRKDEILQVFTEILERLRTSKAPIKIVKTMCSDSYSRQRAAIRLRVPRLCLLSLISTPIVGAWIDIDWLNDRRCRNPIAFGGHALRINGVISHLQRATSGASIPTSDRTACD